MRNLPPLVRRAVQKAANPDPAGDFSAYRDDPIGFNRDVLGRDADDGYGLSGWWSKQCEIAESVVKYHTTLVPTGNMVGKTHLAAGLILWFLMTRPGSIVLATAPSQVQLEEALWKEVEKAYRNAREPLGGRALRSPLKIDMGGGWHALAYSTTTVERLSGHHAGELLVVVDEASGVIEPVYEALKSCGPSRELLIGNPLRPDGRLYDRCMRAREKSDPLVNVIQVASTEGPHIHLERSPWGLADKTWLESARNDYGEGSLWWTTHVLGKFPDAGEDTLISRAWLDRAETVEYTPRGHNRLAIDLAEGKGGDRSVLLVRDDNGVREMESSPNWSFAVVASKAALWCQRWNIPPHRVTYDAQGIGADFGNRLESVGLKGCQPYRGGLSGNKGFGNLRTAAAWKLRQRLDPHRRLQVGKAELDQPPFSIPTRFMSLLRPELQAIRYTLNEKGVVCLEPKEDLIERIRHSPDHADTLILTFGFSDS